MTDLTEQWKKGELPSGWYYVKGSDGLFGMMSDYALYRVNLEHPDNTISLLAPVPSYEEWQELHKRLKDTQNLELEVRRENKQLKELLSKCLDELAEFNNSYYPETQELFSQITNAIGEKK